MNGISYILNVSSTCAKPPFVQDGHFMRIPINDNYSEKMLPYFRDAFQYLGEIFILLVHWHAYIAILWTFFTVHKSDLKRLY